MTRRQKRRSTQGSSPNLRFYIIGAAATLAVVAALIAMGALARGGGSNSTANSAIVVPTPRLSAVPQSDHIFGDPSAPVTVDEYIDFQCPFCRQAVINVMPAIEQQFIATGKAKLVVHPIAIRGSESVASGAAAECANDQGAFFAYYDILYANQGAEQSGTFSDARLKAFASSLNLDTSAFNSCYDSGKYVSRVQQTTSAASSDGVKSTPTIFVNGMAVNATVDSISAAIRQVTPS
jgi:protein-disulfide isomerase